MITKKLILKQIFQNYFLKSVDFSYDKSTKVLENINIEINKGLTYFINGKSGKRKIYFVLFNPWIAKSQIMEKF